MKKVGEIVGGMLVLVFLAFQAGVFDTGAIPSFSASERRAQAPNPWSSGAPEVERQAWTLGGPQELPEDMQPPPASKSVSAPAPLPEPRAAPARASGGSAYYRNCAAARAAGAAPIYRGEPGYRPRSTATGTGWRASPIVGGDVQRGGRVTAWKPRRV